MRVRITTLAALAAAALAAAALAAAALAAPATASAACPGSSLAVDEQSGSELESSILCLINERRADAGLSSVRPNGKLAQAAARHSRDMVARGYFDHTSPGGTTFIERISDAGYMRGARTWLVGENLVWGTGQLSTPANMVKAWMESPPHRANLLRGRFREIGLSATLGTPESAGDDDGVTVASEYGYRSLRKGARKARRAKARARRAKARARRS